MSKSNIHPSSIVENGAQIGEDVTIEPFAVVKKNVVLGNNVVIKSHAYIDGYTTIGDNTTIYPSASIGTKAQALRFNGEKTYVKIGKNCEIREFVTINSSLKANSEVVIGDNCFIMAYSHIAHNSVLGNHVILSNNATLAGHVTIEDYAIIGGMTPIPHVDASAAVLVAAHSATRVVIAWVNNGFSRDQGIWTASRVYSPSGALVSKPVRQTRSVYDRLEGFAVDAAGRTHVMFKRD